MSLFSGAVQEMRAPTVALVAVALAASVAVLEVSDILIVAVGFIIFVGINHSTTFKGRQKAQKAKVADVAHDSTKMKQPRALTMNERLAKNKLKQASHQKSPASTSVPIEAPRFTCEHWDDQVSEFLLQLKPTSETAEVMSSIANSLQGVLRKSMPSATVRGFCQGNPKTSKAYAKAVPEMEFVLSIEDAHLRAFMGPKYREVDAATLYKVALRACTDQLATLSDFKFRRSSFKGGDPMVVLMPPESLEKTPFAFSVNGKIPPRHDAILRACACRDTRARELVFMVQRWARDRGISHEAKGNLPPYAWTILVAHFFQMRFPTEGALVPADIDAVLLPSATCVPTSCPDVTVATLFTEFLAFFCSAFIHGLVTEDVPSSDGASSFRILDPFEPSSILTRSLTAEGRVRLREEFSRAHALCRTNGSLPEVFEVWNPPDAAAKVEDA